MPENPWVPGYLHDGTSCLTFLPPLTRADPATGGFPDMVNCALRKQVSLPLRVSSFLRYLLTADKTTGVLEAQPWHQTSSSHYTLLLHLRGRHFPSNGLDKTLSAKHQVTLQTLSARKRWTGSARKAKPAPSREGSMTGLRQPSPA